MSKKERVKLKRDETFSELDEELESAMADVDRANTEVSGLLERIESGGVEEPAPADESAPPEEDSAAREERPQA